MSTLKKIDFNFAAVPNTLLDDANLRWSAKGVYAHLASKPDGWQFSSGRIMNKGNCGLKVVRSALKELEKYGYLKRIRLASGRMEYQLFSVSNLEKATVPKRHCDKKAPVSNTNSNSKNKGTVAKATTCKKSKNFIQLKKEKIPMEELSYIPEDSRTSRSQSKYGHRTMAILVRTFAESAGIEIKGTFDASPWMTPLSAVYRYFDKDVDATMAFIRRASGFFEEKGLAYTPHTLHKNLLFIDKWLKEEGEKKFSHLDNNPLYE